MANDVEVKTELTLDDSAGEVVKQIQRDFDKLDDEVEDVQSGLKDFGTQFLATFAAVNLVPAIQQFAELSMSIVDVGSAAFDAEQATAGLVAGMTGSEWGVARAYAEDLNRTFNDLTVNVGQAKDDIIAGHKALTTFLGGTSRAMQVASNNMANLTAIANVQGHSVQDLASQFGNMANGFVATESAAFNLLRTTGIFSNDLSKINAEWQKLTQDERINRLEGAFASIADNLSEAPPTLSDMLTSIKGIGNEFLETFGKSAMTEFMGGLGELRGDLQGARGDIRQFATDMGRELGTFVNDAIKWVRENGENVKDAAMAVKDAVVTGFQFARDTIAWILENKTQLMVLGGLGLASRTGLGRAAAGAVGGVVTGATGHLAGAAGIGKVESAMVSLTKTMGTTASAGAKLGQGIGALMTAIAAGGPAMWAAAAAATALGAGIVYMVDKANEAEEKRQQTVETGLEEFTRLAGKFGQLTKEEIARMDQLKAAAEEAASSSFDQRRVSEKFDAIWQDRLDNITNTYIQPLMKVQRDIETLAAASASASDDALADIAMREQNVIMGFSDMFRNAWKTHNDAAMQYIIRLLNSSDHLKNAFFSASDLTAEGFAKLAEVAETMGDDFATLASHLRDIQGSEITAATGKTSPQINFNGGQVFKIQQEFREQDPDRIAVAFERRIIQSATSRVQAATSTPFGT